MLDLGPTVTLPIAIALLCKVGGMKAADAFRAGIHIGIGFVGIRLVISLMLESIGPASRAMADNFHITPSVVDIGWPGASPMTWASKIALVSIPIAITVNVAMLAFHFTRVVNVDVWNIWHMTFSGAIVHIATNSYWLGLSAVAVHAALAYKLGDWFSIETQGYYGLEGVAVPHGTSAYLGPIAVLVDLLIDKCPRLNRISFRAQDIQKKLGAFGEPVSLGFIMGAAIGALAGYDVKDILHLAIKTSAVMLLMPKMVKPIMEGLTPISKLARKRLQEKFGGRDFLIGLDPALLLGDASVVTASLVFIPISIAISVLIPGNRVLPFGDLATVGFFVAMAVAVHRGNLFRTLISGTIIMAMTIWIANQTIELHTALARITGALPIGTAEVASLDQGGAPITYILVQIFTLQNVVGLVAIGAFYGLSLYVTYLRYRRNTTTDGLLR